jgi:two-component system LytT family response regulator
MTLKALIVDDELNARLALRGVLEENFPEITVVGECSDVPSAVQAIYQLSPNVVFLDISMPGYSGLELLNFFSPDKQTFKIVFVTAHNEYAINAFELSAIDYLLKPVRIEALRRAIGKLSEQTHQKFALLKENLQQQKSSKIALQTGDGITLVAIDDILYLKAEGSYTHFYTVNSKPMTITKKISEFEAIESRGNFMRVHRSHVVNLNRIRKILKKDRGVIEMENGDMLSISADKKQELLDRFQGIGVL